MGFNIDPVIAKKCYEKSCERLEELMNQREELIANSLPTTIIDCMIEKEIEIRDGCAYFM